MSLLDRITSLPPPAPPPPNKTGLLETVKKIKLAFPDYQTTDNKDIDDIILRIKTSIDSWDWTSVTEGDVSLIIRYSTSKLIDLPFEVYDFLFNELKKTTKINLFDALCEGFLASWTPQDPHTQKISKLINEIFERLPLRWRKLLNGTPELLDTNNGAVVLGKWLATQDDPYTSILNKGISAPHGLGFMMHVHDNWLITLPQIIDELSAKKIFNWITPTRAPKLEGDRAAAAVAKLLSPWITRMPTENYRNFLVNKIIESYGDPHKNSNFWIMVGEDARRVMLRWLAGRRMEAFIEVVTRAEAKGDNFSQWDARRRFWKGLYDQGYIDEAWVALTKQARVISQNLLRETGDISYANYGIQDGARKDICLLIMQCRDKILVEGSNNFRVHIFKAGSNGSPKLYDSSYDVDNFLLPRGHSDEHWHDPPGHWMTWVRKKII